MLDRIESGRSQFGTSDVSREHHQRDAQSANTARTQHNDHALR